MFRRSLSTVAKMKPVTIKCLADVCVIPVSSPSVSDEVAKIQLLLKETGIKHTLHSAGSTLEGEWDTCMNVIGQIHEMLHKEGVLRVQSDIRVGTRTDKGQTAQDKIDIVHEKMKRGFNN
ncbi:hypothetical protein BN7_3229 [Wickerhamomyces ciferrii]|uniref:Thiamine-binding protein domain-containing protein n=1 Tax=Wickerhamomyces ciferrii (strain ATCC 14091 / BCRC 22168 / CBS 111 / JCM 3599 / NBRC 0793 / NRRL Y-1031 F-60-10) TaxID=1206466 RepID=K0KKY9_WICCF|nr:uncharacterized protein BN7_3229 [Wickerhamomyces ciferrii]CCH43676.1 hypothetical protein BN7_3229 [Wickerhamomyces ciferrii]